MMTEQTNQINILSYLQIFFRRKWFFIIPLAAGLLAGFFVANVLPKIYESYTVILVQEEKHDNPIISGLTMSTTAAQRLSNLRERILGWNSLVKLADKLGLSKDIKNQAQFENLILNDLRRNIVVNMRGPSLVRIAYRSENPDKTQLTVRTISDIFIEENVTLQSKESDVAIAFLEEQMKIYKNKIKASEIAELEDQLKSLLIDSTEEHPMVKDLRVKIAKLKEDLPEGVVIENSAIARNPLYEKLKKDLEKEIASIRTSQTQTQAMGTQDAKPVSDDDLYKVALASTVLARDMNVNESIYNMLLQRLEAAKISQRLESSREGTRYIVLDPPRIPLAPIKPNKIMVVLMCGFLGGALGAGIIVLLELMDTSLLGLDEAKIALNMPILGAISKIMTPDDIARKKAQSTMRLGISISAGITFVLLVIIYSIITKP